MNAESKKIAKTFKKEKKAQFGDEQKNTKNYWQRIEDARVLQLVEKFGYKWSNIARTLGNRTGKQVRDRYLNYLCPNIKYENFTQEEDELLISYFRKLGNKWRQIADYLPGRSECQVKNRYYAHIKKTLKDPEISGINISKEVGGRQLENKSPQLQTKLCHRSLPVTEETTDLYPLNEINRATVYPENNHSFTPIENLSLEVTTDAFSDSSEPISHDSTGYFQPAYFNKNMSSSVRLPGFRSTNYFGMSFGAEEDLLGLAEASALENDYEDTLHKIEKKMNRIEKEQKHETLVSRKKALEFFYSKTLQDLADLENSDGSDSENNSILNDEL